jgi:hypothetical protein
MHGGWGVHGMEKARSKKAPARARGSNQKAREVFLELIRKLEGGGKK